MTDLRPFSLGEWRVEPAAGTLTSSSAERHLEPRIMSVLCCLADRRGEVVSQDQLLDIVWGESRFVGTNTLAQAIHKIRKALGDRPREPRFIETLHKRGYRLVHELVREEPPAGVAPGPSLSSEVPTSEVPSEVPGEEDTLYGFVETLERTLSSLVHSGRTEARGDGSQARDPRIEALARDLALSIVRLFGSPELRADPPHPHLGDDPRTGRPLASPRSGAVATGLIRLGDLPADPPHTPGAELTTPAPANDRGSPAGLVEPVSP